LPKLAKYKHVYITEGQPLVIEGPPNPDKRAGADVRYDWRTGYGRGVELDLPPWNLALQEVVRSKDLEYAKGFIITHRILAFGEAQ
jgi:hypothetical protein